MREILKQALRSALLFATAVLSCDAASPKPGAVLVDEGFQSAPGAVSVNGFKAYGGSWNVENGILTAGAGAGPKLVHESVSLSTGEVGVEMWLGDKREGNAALIVKVTDPGVGADRFHGYEIALDARAGVLRLGRHRQNFELIRDVPCPVPVNEWIPVVARLTETTIEVLVNGRSVIRYEDKEHPLREGAVGFRSWRREAR